MFFVIEGPNGSGTTSVSRVLRKKIVDKLRIPAMLTHEPSGLPIGSLIRCVLRGEIEVDTRALAPLFLADAIDHNRAISRYVNPKGDCIVVCDRYVYSNYVYQQDLYPKKVLEGWLGLIDLVPDAVFVLDADPEVCIQRIKSRTKDKQIHDSFGVDRLAELSNRYKNLAKIGNETIHYIDANLVLESVVSAIFSIIENLLRNTI